MSQARIVLDPGHGGYDPGAVAFGLEEKKLNLKLALKAAEQLSDQEVLLNRDRDLFVSLSDRVAISKRVNADLFVSLHVNAGGGRGFESFIYSGLPQGSAVEKIQENLHLEIMTTLEPWQIRDRGHKQAAFYVLKYNSAPAVLIESLFIDNEREALLWQSDKFVEALAKGVSEGIRQTLKLPPGKQAPGEAAPKGSLYTVQVGAFAYPENARQRLAEAKAAGFKDAFIYYKER